MCILRVKFLEMAESSPEYYDAVDWPWSKQKEVELKKKEEKLAKRERELGQMLKVKGEELAKRELHADRMQKQLKKEKTDASREARSNALD